MADSTIAFISNVLEGAISKIDQIQSEDEISTLILRLEYLNRVFVGEGLPDSFVSSIGDVLTILKGMECEHETSSANIAASRRRGRPSFDIKEEQLTFLVENDFKVPEISSMLGVSTRTVERRLASFGIRISGKYSEISDPALDEVVREIQGQHPGVGIRMLKGHLKSQGFTLQRERIRQSLLRTDPTGVLQRWCNSIRRRMYSVPFPQALWHIDGNHKLIRWRIVVHGGVDGYSRMPVYLHASNNNKASTVLELFKKAVSQHGLPSRVRCDKGGENYDVGSFMLNHPSRGPGRRSIIAGKSTHNQRIERLWRDVFQGCLNLFYDLFYHLESCNLLDPSNDIHLWCLHFVYLPIINNNLKDWSNAWARHPIRTARNQSPLQLWIRGLHITFSSQLGNNETLGEDFGIDWQGPVPDDVGTAAVEVPDTSCPVDEHQLPLLRNIIRDGSDTYAIRLYGQVLSEVEKLVQ